MLTMDEGSKTEQEEEGYYLYAVRICCIPIIILLLWDTIFFMKLVPALAPLFDNLSSILIDI